MARRTGLEPIALSWFGLKNDWLTHWRYRGLIRGLLGCDFVLTDVYHMAATSLRMRLPAVAIGRVGAAQTSTLSDLKKKGLFRGVGADNLYHEAEHGRVTPALATAVAETSARIVASGGLEPAVREALDARPRALRARLRSEIGL